MLQKSEIISAPNLQKEQLSQRVNGPLQSAINLLFTELSAETTLKTLKYVIQNTPYPDLIYPPLAMLLAHSEADVREAAANYFHSTCDKKSNLTTFLFCASINEKNLYVQNILNDAFKKSDPIKYYRFDSLSKKLTCNKHATENELGNSTTPELPFIYLHLSENERTESLAIRKLSKMAITASDERAQELIINCCYSLGRNLGFSSPTCKVLDIPESLRTKAQCMLPLVRRIQTNQNIQVAAKAALTELIVMQEDKNETLALVLTALKIKTLEVDLHQRHRSDSKTKQAKTFGLPNLDDFFDGQPFGQTVKYFFMTAFLHDTLSFSDKFNRLKEDYEDRTLAADEWLMHQLQDISQRLDLNYLVCTISSSLDQLPPESKEILWQELFTVLHTQTNQQIKGAILDALPFNFSYADRNIESLQHYIPKEADKDMKIKAGLCIGKIKHYQEKYEESLEKYEIRLEKSS